MIKLKDIIKEILQEWHENARLEAFYNTSDRSFYNSSGRSFIFFRNGLPAGEIRSISPDGYLAGFGVKRSLQGTGFGKAMLGYAFEKTNLPFFTLDTTTAQAFYHKVGGEKEKGKYAFTRFKIDKEKLKPSPFKFTDIDSDTAKKYLAKIKGFPKIDPFPSRN